MAKQVTEFQHFTRVYNRMVAAHEKRLKEIKEAKAKSKLNKIKEVGV